MMFAFYRVTAVILRAYTMPLLYLYVPVCIRHTPHRTHRKQCGSGVTLKVIGV